MSLRIVHIISSLKVGGMEQFAIRLAARQRQSGDAASVMALQGGALAETAARAGVETCVLGGASKAVRVMKAIVSFRRLAPAIVHGHNTTSLHYAALAKRFGRCKIVITCHGRGRSYTAPPPDLWQCVDRVVCVSDAVASETKDAVPQDRVSVIRNGVDPALPARDRSSVRSELGLGAETAVIIVARMDGMKGHDALLRAWATLPPLSPKPKLLIAGDGAARPEMEALAESLGISSSVNFLGFRSDVPDLLAAADVFVLPSLSEGLPLSILEAMAAGLPVVATDVGGVPEVVSAEQSGVLVPVNDVAALAAALTRVLSDPDLRAHFGGIGRNIVESEFTFDAMIRQYESVYRSMGR